MYPNYGIRGHTHKFIKSYLTNRSQFTYVNGAQSRTERITCGVPQGSVLGPLLFLVYVNDLHRCIQTCFTRLFADDTCFSMFNKNPHALRLRAVANFKQFAKWCECNRLTINYDKTNFILFHAKNKNIPFDFDKIEVNGNVIKRVASTKYLGMYIDEGFTWQKHVSYLHKSLLKYYGIFNRIKYFVNKSITRQLYFAFVYSRIKYGIEVYGSCAQELIQKLQVVQNGLLKLLL